MSPTHGRYTCSGDLIIDVERKCDEEIACFASFLIWICNLDEIATQIKKQMNRAGKLLKTREAETRRAWKNPSQEVKVEL